ncbi:MAG: hypothetical protein KGL39_43875 [Patescibacteria group bacterium]|nr:hypothetical protein [Patescibacteria group bacterium]
MSAWNLTYLDFGSNNTSYSSRNTQGSQTLVPADGSSAPTGTYVPYSANFPTNTTSIQIGLESYSGADNAQLGYRIISKDKTGFYIVVGGGAPSSTVTVDYNAFGD